MFGLFKSRKTRERERDLVQALLERLRAADWDQAKTLLADDFRATSPQQQKTISSSSEFIDTVRRNRDQCEVVYAEEVAIEGSEYLLRFTASYPDGREAVGLEFYRVKGDRIVSMTGQYGVKRSGA